MEDKAINLDQAYRVTLYIGGNKNKPYVQFIEAHSVDDAINKASNTFSARLYGLDSDMGSITQKACDKAKEPKGLTFGFGSGHITIHSDNTLTIFEMLEKATAHPIVEGRPITEITTKISEYM